MAGSKRVEKGSLPKRACKSRQRAGAPGTVTESQPFCGVVELCRRTSSRVRPAGARPDPLMPEREVPSQTRANASEPMPLDVGSTTVRAIAVAIAASTALPPSSSIFRPACTARGWLVATTPFGARTEWRFVLYGFDDRSMGGNILPPTGGSAGVRDGAGFGLPGPANILPIAFAPPMSRAALETSPCDERIRADLLYRAQLARPSQV